VHAQDRCPALGSATQVRLAQGRGNQSTAAFSLYGDTDVRIADSRYDPGLNLRVNLAATAPEEVRIEGEATRIGQDSFVPFATEARFTSSNPRVLTVGRDGVVQAHRKGTATVSATVSTQNGAVQSTPLEMVVGGDPTSEACQQQPINYALWKTASQSSVDYDGVPERAVDGDTNGDWHAGSVTHTRGEPESWWQVDLGAVAEIDEIAVWNRGDCCAERLTDYYVLVSDLPFTSASLDEALAQPGVWSQHFAETAGRPTRVDVGRTGRYVRVQLAGNEPLALAEVQVF